MDEYIEREALMAALCKEIIGDGDYYNGKDDMQDEIRDMVSQFPSADVAPVRHGRWLPQVVLGQKAWDCSECKTLGSPHWKWCPVCGAKMDGGFDNG